MVGSEIDKLYSVARAEVCNLLAQAGNVCLTLDIWSDQISYGFLRVTAHMILDFELKTRLLASQQFLMKHSSKNINQGL